MLEWYVSYTDDPQDFYWIDLTRMADREEIERAFKEAALAGAYRRRPLQWMLLVDAGAEHADVLACYGDNPPPTLAPLGGNSHRFTATTGRYPSLPPRSK